EDLLQERQRLRAVLDGPAAERGEERRGVHVERARSFAQEVAMTAGAGALELRLEQSEHLADAPADPARMAGRLAVARGEHPRDRQRKSARALRRDPRLDDGEPTAPTEPALSRDLVEQTKRANPRPRLGGAGARLARADRRARRSPRRPCAAARRRGPPTARCARRSTRSSPAHRGSSAPRAPEPEPGETPLWRPRTTGSAGCR